jgi:hypothetical protein
MDWQLEKSDHNFFNRFGTWKTKLKFKKIDSKFQTKKLPGANSLRCTKILSQCHHFLSFLSSHFVPCKDTFMDDYYGI